MVHFLRHQSSIISPCPVKACSSSRRLYSCLDPENWQQTEVWLYTERNVWLGVTEMFGWHLHFSEEWRPSCGNEWNWWSVQRRCATKNRSTARAQFQFCSSERLGLLTRFLQAQKLNKRNSMSAQLSSLFQHFIHRVAEERKSNGIELMLLVDRFSCAQNHGNVFSLLMVWMCFNLFLSPWWFKQGINYQEM